MTPARMSKALWGSLAEKRAPTRFAGLRHREHLGLFRQLVRLARIALDTRTNHVFPGSRTAFVSRNHVVQVQFPWLVALPAILAGEFVPLENTLPAELHFLPRDPVVAHQNDDGRNPEVVRDRPDHVVSPVIRRFENPRVGIVSQEIRLLVRMHHLRMPQEKEADGPFGAADMNRLPKPIEHQDLAVDGLHDVLDSTMEKECINQLFLLQICRVVWHAESNHDDLSSESSHLREEILRFLSLERAKIHCNVTAQHGLKQAQV